MMAVNRKPFVFKFSGTFTSPYAVHEDLDEIPGVQVRGLFKTSYSGPIFNGVTCASYNLCEMSQR